MNQKVDNGKCSQMIRKIRENAGFTWKMARCLVFPLLLRLMVHFQMVCSYLTSGEVTLVVRKLYTIKKYSKIVTYAPFYPWSTVN